MTLVALFKKFLLPFALLLATASPIQAEETAKEPNASDAAQMLSLDELRTAVGHLKVNKETCDLDYLEMLGETIANYVNRKELTEKEGIQMLVRMSFHANACRNIKH